MRALGFVVIVLCALCSQAAAERLVPLRIAERVTIAVVGDSLADGVWGGFYRYLVRDRRHALTRATKNSIGFAGGDLQDLLDVALQSARPDAVVMMIGANDRRSLFVDGRSVALLGTPQWRDHYRNRVALFVERLEREGIPLVWILPPIVRSPEADADYQMITGLIRAAAANHTGVWLLDARPLSADAAGQYASHYKDLNGRVQLMRADDGIHFTPPGYEILAVHALSLLRQQVPAFADVADMPPPAVTSQK